LLGDTQVPLDSLRHLFGRPLVEESFLLPGPVFQLPFVKSLDHIAKVVLANCLQKCPAGSIIQVNEVELADAKVLLELADSLFAPQRASIRLEKRECQA